MNRQDFAEQFAAAYMNQYGDDGSPVMGLPVVIYNTESSLFSWQSEHTPLTDAEYIAQNVEKEMAYIDQHTTADDIAQYVMASDNWWRDVQEVIAIEITDRY